MSSENIIRGRFPSKEKLRDQPEEQVLLVFRENGLLVRFQHQRLPFGIETLGVTTPRGPYETVFFVRPNQPLYPGLPFVHQSEPEALPRVIRTLQEYAVEHEVGEEQATLINHALHGLTEIVYQKKQS